MYYNVDYIHTAIYENKQIKFHYAEWTVKKKLKLKKNGAFYVISLWALTWDDENYYMVAFDSAKQSIRHYRVDKMKDIKILNKEKCKDYSKNLIIVMRDPTIMLSNRVDTSDNIQKERLKHKTDHISIMNKQIKKYRNVIFKTANVCTPNQFEKEFLKLFKT